MTARLPHGTRARPALCFCAHHSVRNGVHGPEAGFRVRLVVHKERAHHAAFASPQVQLGIAAQESPLKLDRAPGSREVQQAQVLFASVSTKNGALEHHKRWTTFLCGVQEVTQCGARPWGAACTWMGEGGEGRTLCKGLSAPF